jgi:UDP-N-acetylglucosamine transferase subunit ALG13
VDLLILVALGTQDKPFSRLLDGVKACIENGLIQEKVVVQAGLTPYRYEKMEIFDLLDKDEFGALLNRADLLITHAGAGSILSGLKAHKKVIACARRQQYGEHTNDHQVQILARFDEEGYLIAAEPETLGEALEKAKTFVPKPFVSNTKAFEKVIEEFLHL